MIYRLRGMSRTYEEVRFRPAAHSASTAQVLIPTNLSAKWRQDFDRDRGAVLAACASGALR